MFASYHRDARFGSVLLRALLLGGLVSSFACGGGGTTQVAEKKQPPPNSPCPQAEQPCASNLGCPGTLACLGGQVACQAPARNNCGICGATDETGLGTVCQGPGGRPGVLVCGTTGGTVCATTVVSLTVDDTFDDAELAAAAFEAHGMRVTFYVNSPRFVLGSGYMTLDQVLALQQKGHEIGGHTLDHPHLPAMTSDQQHLEICHDRAELLNAGLDIKDFAYPFGAYRLDGGIDVRQTVQDCGYNSARAIGGIGDSVADPASAEGFVPRDLWAMRTPSSIGATTTLQQMKDYVTNAENAGGWIMINMHHVCTGDRTNRACISHNHVLQSDLNAFLDWLEPRLAPGTGTVMQTIRQMVWGPTRPPVDWTPVDPPPGTNLLANPSLEEHANVGLADCWEPKGLGMNTTSWGPGVPHTGASAVRLDMTSYSNGARGLMTKREWQSCTPVLIPGKRYTLSAWYMATTPPLFQIDFAFDDAWLTWLVSSTEMFPISNSYYQATWTTPPVPEGVQQISMGLMIDAVGSLTVDDLSLVELK